jgi:hypothetical protein
VKRALAPLGGVVLAFVIIGALIARLRRIERPVTDVVATSADGRVSLLRVRLARRGETGHTIGFTLRCDGRVVWNRLGADRVLTIDAHDGLWRLLDDQRREFARGVCSP